MSTLFLVLIGIVSAQEETTPTPAASKTPTPVGETEATREPAQPLTQKDLSILTGNVQRPNGITWFNNKLYTACNGDFTLYEIDSITAATRTYIYGVRNAHTLYAETTSEGRLNLWIPDFETNRLLFIDGTGAPDPIVTDLGGPWGIAYLNEDEFLITNQRDNSLVVVSRDGDTREIATDLRLPAGIVADDEFVYVANYGRPRQAIEWFNRSDIPAIEDSLDTEAPEEAPESLSREVLVSGLQNTTGLALGADGNLYFAYALGTRGVVGRVDPQECRESGGCSNDQVEIVLYTDLAAPLAGPTLSPDMRLFIHTMFSPDIYWVALDAPVIDD
ncbi:MAG: hypothetical protein K8L99_15040 [Anaerolineae bacterium]|nr:hypothetical protein [Anaerolineae bacterium]